MERKGFWFIRRWLLQGVIIALPIVLTTIILYYLVIHTDAALWFVWDLVTGTSPSFSFPGLGLIVTVLGLVGIGFLTESYVVRHIIDLFNTLVSKVPFIKNIYTTIHKIVQSVLGNKENLSKVVLVEYPCKDTYCLAFLTSEASPKFATIMGEEAVNIFLPTTPNPTSGFYLIVPRRKVKETDLTSEEAFKLIISAGIVDN